MLTRDDLIELLRRTCDEGWLADQLANPDNLALINSAAAVWSRVSECGDAVCAAAMITEAPGGAPGVATVTLIRPAAGTSGTIPAGYLFVDDRGILAIVMTDVPVAAGATSVDVPVVTLRQTSTVNTVDPVTFEVAPASPIIWDDTGLTILLAPPGTAAVVPTTLAPGSSTAIAGGASDWLSGHGAERGTPRQASELTEDYRARVRNIPDAVSPAAIAEAVHGVASSYGLGVPQILEPSHDGASAEARARIGLGVTRGFFFDSGCCLDDPSYEVRGFRESRAYIRVDLPAPTEPERLLMVADDSFYDAGCFPDIGMPPRLAAGLGALSSELDRKVGAAVQHDIFLGEFDTVIGVGAVLAGPPAPPAVAFTLTPPAGKAWYWVTGTAGIDAAPLALPDGAAFALRITYVTGEVVTTPLHSDPGSKTYPLRRLLELGGAYAPISQIEGLVAFTGPVPVNMVGTFRLLPIATT